MNVQKIANFINHSPRTQKVLKNISNNPALFCTFSAFLVSTTVRPATTLAITPNKKDGIYGATSSVSSALVELFAGYSMLKPMQKLIDKSSKTLYNLKGSIFYQNPNILRQYKSISNRVFKMPTIIITSLLRFSLVHPMAVLFGKLGITKSIKDLPNENKSIH